MADIKTDFLSLNYSPSFSVEGIQEADINLSLPPAEVTCTVFGVVTDNGVPVPNATVKLFDSTGLPFKHTLTDTDGQYSMDGVPAAIYTISAVCTGYRLSPATGVILSSGGSTEVNFALTPDTTLSLGAIAGTLTTLSGTTVVPVSGAKITLSNNTSTVIATTHTVDDGEFAFYDVADGVYTVLATADGYLTSAPMAVTIVNGSIANLNMTMVVDSRTYNGTVSGIIRDQNGMAVAGCFVSLYQVTNAGQSTQQETLIATTKTNVEGKYLFGNVAAGEYLVKAKLEQ